jgi:methylenetetrahydrofolate reductase (NADPH)
VLGAAPHFFVAGRGPGDGRAAPASVAALRRYRLARVIHRLVFHRSSPLYRALRPLARRVSPGSRVEAWLIRTEQRIKGPLFDCRMCGFCRLPEAFYVCPERCPKGLASGPCGGSMNNRCEAGTQECVHSVRYRLAKALGQRERLERVLVPPTPDPRGGSSWLRHFAGARPATGATPVARPRASGGGG